MSFRLTFESNLVSAFFSSISHYANRIIVVHSSGVRRKSSAIRKTDSTPAGFKVSCWINLPVLLDPLFFCSRLTLARWENQTPPTSGGDYFESFFNPLIDYIAAWRNSAGLMNNLSSPRFAPTPNFFNIKSTRHWRTSKLMISDVRSDNVAP